MTKIELCKAFIKDYCIITDRINYNNSSYGFKHIVENWAGEYISNDDFIDACLELGLKHEDMQGRVIGNPKYQYNKYFNIKKDKKKMKTIQWKYNTLEVLK